MKIDRTKLKKGSSEVPSDCKRLIERLKNCSDTELLAEIKSIKVWNYGKSELCHWIDVLDLFDSILERGVKRERENQWSLPCDSDDDLKELMVHVIVFTALLIEHSFSRNSYNSMEHLTTLLSSSDMQIVLAVLNLLYAFSKRSNFISRLNSQAKQALIQRLNYLAESWGGKENGFGLAECCQDLPLSSYPSSATNLHFEFYTDEPTNSVTGGTSTSSSSTQTPQSLSQSKQGSMSNASSFTTSGSLSKHTATTLNTIHVDNVDQIKDKTLAQLMEELVETYNVPKSKQMLLFTHLRLAHSFSNYRKRLQCVQARLQALSVIVYCNAIAIQENGNNILYNGFIEELVDVLEIKSNKLHDIKAAALRTLTSVIHLDHSSKLTTIIDVTGASSYHGFLPSLVRSCIQALIDGNIESFPIPFATALFSFLYHLASYENGGEALVSCGMIESLLKVINWNGSDPEHITFVIRSVRVIDLITNLDMSAFQTHNGISIFINRLESEVDICKKEQPFVIEVPSSNNCPQEGDFSLSISDEPTASPAAASGGNGSGATASGGSGSGSSSNNASVNPSDPSASVPVSFSPSDSPMAAETTGSVSASSPSVNIPGQMMNNSETPTVMAPDGSPMEVDSSPKPSTSSLIPSSASGSASQPSSSNIVTAIPMPAINKDLQCYPQRAALLKSMLNFLKKAIQDSSFSDQIRRLMDSSLPNSLRHIVSNAEYYGASLFILATDVITVYVFQEPSLLSTLQENGLTTVVLQAFLSKEIPATREVLSTLPNVFSALCLNSRGLESFTACKPFEKVFKVLISPEYLPAMRRRRSADPMGDTASNLGNAMDELMRHQPRLRQDATIAIVNLLNELCALGSNPNFVCSKSPLTKSLEGSQGTTGVDGSAPGAPNRPSMATGNDAGSSDEEEEEDEDATNGPTNTEGRNKETTDSALALASTESGQVDEKQHVPLVDYILNVMRFVEAILSNNSTDDHCREFVKHKGLSPLLRILLLPNLPIDFPVNTACLAVASVCKSILTLAHEREVLREGLKLLSEVLGRLSGLHKPLEAPGGSVLLDEFLNATVQSQSMATVSGQVIDPLASASLTPLLHAMSAAHAMISMFVHVSRTGQSDTRNLCITHWGSELGISVLDQLSELYTSLVWESTVLLALCSDQAANANWQFGRHQLEKLSALMKDSNVASTSSGPSVSVSSFEDSAPAMEVDEPVPTINAAQAVQPVQSSSTSSPSSSSKKRDSKQGSKMSPQVKQIKPLLSSASRLGRALAELFGLLVKLSVGTPLRQRRSHHSISNVPLPPTPASRAISVSLTSLLARGLSWEPPATSPIPKFRLTFYICSVGFTSPMLFDERKYPYHLMLQNFVQYGGQKAFFDTFKWALTQGGKVSVEEGIEHPDLPDGTGEFLDTWLTLLEKMINPKNILESPHSLPPNPMNYSSPGLQFPQFDPLRYLIAIHKKAFECIMCLWNKKPIKTYGEKMSETVLTILCHLLKGESIIAEKLAKEKAEAEAANAGSSSDATSSMGQNIAPNIDSAMGLDRVYIPGRLAARPGAPPSQQPQINPDHLQQLIEMGFPRELALEALMQTNSLEAATEYVLSHPPPARIPGPPDMEIVEEYTVTRAIALALEDSITNNSGESTESAPKPPEDEPLSKEQMDDFTKDILPGCLRLLDTIPETVYRACDLLNAVATRNGEEWICRMFQQLIDEITLNINKLLVATNPLTSSDKRTITEWATQVSSMPEALKAATRIHLFSLLFEDTNRRNRCAYMVQQADLIENLVLLLERAHNNMSIAAGFGITVSTPKWLAPVILLIDLYDKAAVASERRFPLLHMQRRQWKWFDDRAGKWTPYIATNNKTIDDAYKAGEPYIRFTPGRRKYTVHFNTMVQINEETNSWRPIMFVNDDKAMEVNEDSNPTGDSSASINAKISEFKVLKGLEESQKTSLIRSCVEFISAPVEPESLHAVMRLCLRITRSHDMATLFAEQGGVRAILHLTHNNAFSGFISLASLIVRHVLEESSMLRQTMEKVVRSSVHHAHASLKEMHYVLRGLGPAACRDKQLFIDVAKSSLRIFLPPLTKREDEDTRSLQPNAPQVLKLIPGKPPTTQLPSKTAKQLVCDLLNSLTVKVAHLTPTDEVKELPGSSSLVPPPTGTAGSSAAVTPTGPGPAGSSSTVDAAPTRQREADDIDEDSVENSYIEFNPVDFKNKEEENKKNRPLMSQSSLLRLLAELARSYTVVAKLITEHTYTVGQSELITEDCSALAFILDHLLPATQTTGDKDCPALARVLIAALSSCNHCIDAQSQLVAEVKASLNRALNLVESSEKHARIQAIAAVMNTMIESCPSVTPSSHQLPPSIRASASLSNMVRLMLRKGLVNDLARVTHSLDLSSPQMALTVNSVLKPLETLSRVVNQIGPMPPVSKKSKSNAINQEQMEDSTNPTFIHVPPPLSDAGVLMSQTSETGSLTEGSFRVDEMLSSTRTDDPTASEQSAPQVRSANAPLAAATEMSSVSDTHAYADATVDDATDSEAAAAVFGEENLTIDSITRVAAIMASQDEEMRHEPNDDSVNIDDTGVNESHDAAVNGANAGADTESDGESDSDDEDDDEDDDDDDDDDDNSGAENEDEDEEDDDQAEVDDDDEEEGMIEEGMEAEGNLLRMIGGDDDFLFDIDEFIPANILRDGISGLIPMLEAEYPPSGGQSAETTQPTVPPAPNSVAVSHPLLNRNQEIAGGIMGNAATAPASILATRSQRMPRSRVSRYPRESTFSSAFNRHFPIHSRYTNQPLILQRLLGNSSAQDYLQITTGSASNPGRVIMSGNEFHIIATDDVTDLFELHDANPYMPHGSNQTLGAIPSAMVRWTEESRVLDGDSIHDCIASIKPEIIGFLEEIRDQEIAERKEKRRKLIEEDERKRAESKKPHESLNQTFTGDTPSEVTNEQNNATITATSTVFTGSPEGGQTVVRVESDSNVNASTERLAASLVEQVLAPVVGAVSSANGPTPAGENTGEIVPPADLPISSQPSSSSNAPMQEESSPTSPTTEWMEVPGQSFPNEDSSSVNRRLDDMDVNSGGGSSNDEPQINPPSTSSPPEQADEVMMNFTVLPQEDSAQAATQGTSDSASSAAQDDALMNIGMRRVSSDTNTFAPVNETFSNDSNADASNPPVDAPAPEAPAASSSDANQNLESDIPEGVDPSFLAALPEQIRQEVIAEQRRLLRQRNPQAASSGPGPSSSATTSATADLANSEISPEFLAALPPAIQEEVLAQQRLEREQHQPANPDAPVDPANFFQTLPPSLRRQVLADMDDSQIALLPPDLQAEAQALRTELEHRHRQIQERFFTSQANSTLSRILRSAAGGPGRVSTTRYAIHALTSNGNPWPWNISSSRTTGSSSGPGGSNNVMSPSVASRNSANSRYAGRQLLDHEALSCLLILLFVDEPKLNVSRLHRVLKNLSHHTTTRQWVIQSLLTIMERTRESREIDLTPRPKGSSSQSFQQGQKSVSGHQVASWLSISLDAALGCKTNVFQIQRPFSGTTGSSSSSKRSSSTSGPLGQGVTIHPQAAPLVTRHVLDALISLAKSFPDQFLVDSSLSLPKEDTGKLLNSSTKDSSDAASSKFNKDADFWDVLVKLDSLSTSKKGKSVLKNHPSASCQSTITAASSDSESSLPELPSPLRSIINLLSHPVIRRSAPLTDRLLRLLSLISAALPQTVNSGASQGDSVIKSSSKPINISNEQSNRPLVGEEQLRLAVEVLTSKSCSEEGLEDVNQLLLRLSESCPKTREIVLKLLLEGAQQLGKTVRSNIDSLYEELRILNIRTRDETASTSFASGDDVDAGGRDKSAKGILHDRFTHGQVVITAPTNFKPNVTSKEVQLPSMATLTSKTSSQSFFLRILKVIIQLKKSIKAQKKKESNRSTAVQQQQHQQHQQQQQAQQQQQSQQQTGHPPQQSTQSASQQQQQNQSETDESRRILNQTFEMDVDVMGGWPNTSTPVKMDDAPILPAEDATLSVQLALDDLWNSLSQCLVELADAPDHHAVLVLQPAVEAFFLVHSSDKEPRRNSRESRLESRENQLAHLNADIQPASPSASDSMREDSSAPGTSGASGSAVTLPSDTHKFLQFAETHKLVLNQILRQSTTPLAEGPFAVLVDHTRVLDFDVKRRYFRQELERLDEGVRREDLVVHVRRDHVFEDSFRELYRRSSDEWKNRFYIVFEGEEGQDAGGLLREWYTIISREIFNPMYALFTTSPGDRVTYMINPASHCNSNHLQYFKFVGRVIAKAIYDNKLLECYFTRSFYKHILGKLVKYHDMESEDYSFYQGLVFLLEHDIKELGYELTFSVEVQEFGVTEVRDLKPNGRNIVVTEEAKQEYVRLVCQEKMTGAIRKQLNAFLEGFYEIIPKRLISIFNEQETELLISGLPNIDIDDLRANTEYHKYQASSLQIQWFWRALRSFDQADRAKFLQFVTGTSKVPLQGFASLEGMNGIQKFQIHRDDRSTDRLPSAHTCFNQLDLPAYETYDKLKRFLHLAILECNEGFGFA